MRALAPADETVHFARTTTSGSDTSETGFKFQIGELVDVAKRSAAEVEELKVGVIAFGCMSASFYRGWDALRRLTNCIGRGGARRPLLQSPRLWCMP